MIIYYMMAMSGLQSQLCILFSLQGGHVMTCDMNINKLFISPSINRCRHSQQ